MEDNYIVQRLISSLSELFQDIPTEKYYGVSRSIKVLNHVDNCIILENIKDKDIILALRCAAILHNADNKMFFKESSYNAKNILKYTIPENIKLQKIILKLLFLIRNPYREIKSKTWMLIPRYADMLESIGEVGLVRLYYYYNDRDKPLFLENSNSQYILNKILTTVIPPISYESMIEHYIHLILNVDYLEKSKIPYIVKESRERHDFMKKYISKFDQTQMIKIQDIVKLHTRLQKKKLL